ncbi:MAG: cyclic nucleotide-binding domain-containing protein [Mariprofundaceae bacterium]
MSDVSLPKLLRQVRKAVAQENFQEAEELYGKILENPEMEDNLDIHLRHAYCSEKLGNIEQAIETYTAVIKIYKKSGEEGAAAALEQLIEALQKEPEETEGETADASSNQPEIEIPDSEIPDDAALMERLCNMGELVTFNAGDMLCKNGDMPDHLWLLKSGELSVQLPEYEEPDIIQVKDGHLALVGEVGFFTKQRRIADVHATSVAELYIVRASDIHAQQEKDPGFSKAIDRLLIERWAEPVLTRHTVFERVNDIDRMRIMHSFKRITLGPGETLVEAGEEHDYTYMLQSGCMFFMHSKEQPDDTTETDDGSLMSTVFPGDMIHLGGLLKGYQSDYRVVTATPVQLLRLSREEFEPFTLRRPWIIQAILRFSHRPANLQIMKPEDDYLWKADRHIKTQ